MKPTKQNSLSKREQIVKAGSTVFIAVAVAAVVVSLSVVCSRFLLQRKSYNDRVIKAKSSAREQIENNLVNLKSLAEKYPSLESGTNNPTTILHALPDTYDYPALSSSMEFLAQNAGVQLVGQVGQDNSASAEINSTDPKPLEVPLDIEVRGSYSAIVQFTANLERSIRPIVIKNVRYSGTATSLRASMQAVTYYQPKRLLDASRSIIQ